MLEIKTIKEDKKTTIELTGKLDSTTFSDFENVINEIIDEINELVLDCKNLSYISSAGLRIVLTAHKKMASENKNFVLLNLNEATKEIIDATGLSNFLNIK